MNYNQQEDATLVALTLAGNQDAYSELVVRYQSAVLGAAGRIIRSRYLAEDAAQDSFVTAWMKLDSLCDPAKFGVWVCRIARNCAINMRTRFREYLPDEVMEVIPDDRETPEEILTRGEDQRLLREGVENLPEKIGQVIRMHYFEELSIAEIADRLRVSAGTVKWRLHEGRQRLREDLSAMNETENDTLVQKVQKKVAELKLWQLRYDKKGFEQVYTDVLSDIGKLPESKSKYNMEADVLMRGFWWIDREQTDAIFGRIRDAAELGHNEEVMQFVVSKEDSKVPEGRERIEFIRDKQIPRLKELKFSKTVGYEYFWLATHYLDLGEREAGLSALEQAKDSLTPADVYYAVALSAMKLEQLLTNDSPFDRSWRILSIAEEYRYQDSILRPWSQPGYSRFWIPGRSDDGLYIWYNASIASKRFFFDTEKIGDTLTDEKGNTLTYGGDGHRIVTPAGVFEDCVLWTATVSGGARFDSYYKNGVGIVGQDIIADSESMKIRLSDWTHVGGSGLLPLCPGNRWVYTDTSISPKYLKTYCETEVVHADGLNVTVSHCGYEKRLGYDPESFEETAKEMRASYVIVDTDKNEHLNGEARMRSVMARMGALAKTPLETEHAELACHTMDRIYTTDGELHPDRNSVGIWNFFMKLHVLRKEGKTSFYYDPIYSFEWKCKADGTPQGLYCNFLYDIFTDALDGAWCDELAEEQERTIKWNLYRDIHETGLKVTRVGSLTTPVGSFENCLEFSMEISPISGGWSYRSEKKEYYLAPGVGIVRAIHHFDGEEDAVFELTGYQGVGEGYFPAENGLRRFYEANFRDGYYSAVEYRYRSAEDGKLYLLVDQTGIKKVEE